MVQTLNVSNTYKLKSQYANPSFHERPQWDGEETNWPQCSENVENYGKCCCSDRDTFSFIFNVNLKPHLVTDSLRDRLQVSLPVLSQFKRID